MVIPVGSVRSLRRRSSLSGLAATAKRRLRRPESRRVRPRSTFVMVLVLIIAGCSSTEPDPSAEFSTATDSAENSPTVVRSDRKLCDSLVGYLDSQSDLTGTQLAALALALAESTTSRDLADAATALASAAREVQRVTDAFKLGLSVTQSEFNEVGFAYVASQGRLQMECSFVGSSDDSQVSTPVAPGDVNPAERLGDQCGTPMLQEFVDLEIFNTLSPERLDWLDRSTGVGVVTNRITSDYEFDGGAHTGEVEIEVFVICGRAGTQNARTPELPPGERSTIYSYGGDAVVMNDPQVMDLVFYVEVDYSYGWVGFGRARDSELIQQQLNAAIGRLR